MSKKEQKFYVCVHAPCSFKTDKRKAIYTHLVRTHNERKEDYECEYCSSMFELDTEIERHLHVHHPQQPFTYTCVSRIEKVINNCAKLGTESKRAHTPLKSAGGDHSIANKASGEKKTSPKVENSSPISKPPYMKPNISMRTRASVNESLNNIAKHPKYSDPDEQATLMPTNTNKDNTHIENGSDDEHYGEFDDEEMEEVEIDTDEESPTYISKPSGLKIKLSLKKGIVNDSREVSSERSSSPPLLEPSMTHADDEMDPSELPDETPPDIVRNQPVAATAQVRVKDSKYYDKLEVYHHTDEFGRRCCPFCDYKTSKNTIRVHLSGIHKIHFVKCSLCDYKAAFPHQITQHGIKFHKTTNLNVIQLTKDSRDKTIAQLKKPDNHSAPVKSNQSDTVNVNKTPDDNGTGNEIIDDEDFNSEESYPTSADENETSVGQADDRVFKPPKCQTSKTDYYSIRVENGVYMYNCNLCTFQTPVRATIYTHKYRHEEKSYRCGYCDFTSAPRSNVVHHCRVKHKNSPINVVENDLVDESIQQEPREGDMAEAVPTGSDNVAIKTEPVEEIVKSETNTATKLANAKTGHMGTENSRNTSAFQTPEKSHQTIIKVPQFKRSITSVTYDTISPEEIKRPKTESSDVPGVEYKLSLNKLYRINPTGSPKFMCALCSYACDTHPKMKHHLYRHRPQKYKCPYCDHRKYPRSYVVRHVRDTHRNKPVRVIDLSKGNEPEDIPEYMNEGVADETLDDTAEHIDADVADEQPAASQTVIKQEVGVETIQAGKSDVIANAEADDSNTEQNEEVNALKNFAQKLNLRSVLTTDLNDDIFMQSSDVSPNFSDAVYTSTPLIESYINGQYQNLNTPKINSKNFEKKKSLKDYRVNYGQGPRYICNKCGYGTENYKTIHNHMYRHESQRYQCPYCGYRRSPKSFVENHIREVHKGHPVIVTELSIDQELSDTPTGSPRQCVTLKRKDPPQDLPSGPPTLTVPTKVPKIEDNLPAKIPVKWPAPKPVSQVIVNPQLATSVNFKPNTDDRNLSSLSQPTIPAIQSPQPTMQQIDLKANSPALKSPTVTPAALASQTPSLNAAINPVRFVERNRTTFKTMYKCVFDPETCNHISKDKSKMKQHLFMHVEYKPWSCDFCDMTASQSSHIKNHVRTEHPGVVETSFKYKRHNYLEKHIESFLTKGLFTVPVNEYRAIMDMKGNTKSSKQPTFDRDEEGNLLCPYCSYRTKSGGMTDHVKMKHMQPRFKCHWCDYRAFYRSEVRKHHRKEKSHATFDFKTQELDLVQVMEGYKERNGESMGAGTSPVTVVSGIDPSQYFDDEDDDDDDDDGDGGSECSSSEGSSIGDYQQGYVEYTTEQLTELCTNRQAKVDLSVDLEEDTDTAIEAATNEQALIGSLNTEVGPDGSMKIVQKPKSEQDTVKEKTDKESKFKCGYCSFSAGLRVKVKMHCSKKHANKVLNIIDPSTKPEPTVRQDNLDLDANDWKGTKFEQDLRKAGISKLNLASLFPNSKRFQKSDVLENALHEKSQNVNETAEFKKPLEPVSKVKITDRKSENVEVKNKVVVSHNSDNNTDNHNLTGHSTGNSERDKKSTDILISDVRSLKQCVESKNVDCQENDRSEEVLTYKEQISQNENEPKLDKLMTAFPNCTAVILEDESSDDVSKESDEDHPSGETECETEFSKRGYQETEEKNTDYNSNRQHIDSLKTGNDFDEECEQETDSIAMGKSENNLLQEDEKNDNMHVSMKYDENLEMDVSNSDCSKMESIHLVNGHRFAIDGTLKESCELTSNGELCKDVEEELVENIDNNSKTNVFKLDGTCDGLVGKKLIPGSTEKDIIKTSPLIDLPNNNGSTCAMKDICDET